MRLELRQVDDHIRIQHRFCKRVLPPVPRAHGQVLGFQRHQPGTCAVRHFLKSGRLPVAANVLGLRRAVPDPDLSTDILHFAHYCFQQDRVSRHRPLRLLRSQHVRLHEHQITAAHEGPNSTERLQQPANRIPNFRQRVPVAPDKRHGPSFLPLSDRSTDVFQGYRQVTSRPQVELPTSTSHATPLSDGQSTCP